MLGLVPVVIKPSSDDGPGLDIKANRELSFGALASTALARVTKVLKLLRRNSANISNLLMMIANPALHSLRILNWSSRSG